MIYQSSSPYLTYKKYAQLIKYSKLTFWDKIKISFIFKIMDEYWRSGIQEFGAINITGFRIVQTQSLETMEFLNIWKSLDPSRWPGAGKEHISVS